MCGETYEVVGEKGSSAFVLRVPKEDSSGFRELVYWKDEVEIVHPNVGAGGGDEEGHIDESIKHLAFQQQPSPYSDMNPEVRPWGKEDLTVTADVETVIVAMLQRVGNGGRVAFTANELARARQHRLERRADGHKLELWIARDT